MSYENLIPGKVMLSPGDSWHVLRDTPDNRYDSIVCDPPYALVSIVKRFGSPNAAPAKGNDAYIRASSGFMGKQWDTGEVAHNADFWAEALRVLKPGGHLVAFSSSRTYHRMACAIEDAGFEIRDSLYYHYGCGFPKSHDIGKKLDATKERCSCPAHLRDLRDDLVSENSLSGGAQQDLQSGMHQGGAIEINDGASVASQPTRDDSLRGMWETHYAAEGSFAESVDTDMLKAMQRRVPGRSVGKTWPQGNGGPQDIHADDGSEEPGLEGRRDLSEQTRQLPAGEIRSMPAGIPIDGADRWLCDGASLGNGATNSEVINADGMRSPSRPQAIEQSSGKSGALAEQSQPQTRGAWKNCGRCGKPMVPDGLGTALKPATEPIVLARKPLSEGTVAANVLRWGTGALNIDGCRIGTTVETWPKSRARPAEGAIYTHKLAGNDLTQTVSTGDAPPGRWPANVCHDGSDEVVGMFPQRDGAIGMTQFGSGTTIGTTGIKRTEQSTGGDGLRDSGSAARFFYSAKADSDDRLGSSHPTVKPVDLMQWLVRLVTPKGGLVLDPFAGTGTTGEAAFREGLRAMLIEREAGYQADIRRRMKLAMSGPDERARESIKAKLAGKPIDLGPLFAMGDDIA